MRETSNPVFRSLPKAQGGYAQFGTGAGGYGAQAVHADPYVTQYPDQRQTGVSRPLTIDDVVTKTGITLAVLTAVAVVSYFLVAQNLALATPFAMVGGLGGLGAGADRDLRPQAGQPGDRAELRRMSRVCSSARSRSLSRTFMVSGISAGALISQAVVGTIGVFFGMLVVYKTGAIRVTPKFTRFIVAAMFRRGRADARQPGARTVPRQRRTAARRWSDGDPLLAGLMIGIAAFFFLIDFDPADQAIRAGAPEKAAWGIALGLTVTLVWLYIEILQLLSYVEQELTTLRKSPALRAGLFFDSAQGVGHRRYAPYGAKQRRLSACSSLPWWESESHSSAARRWRSASSPTDTNCANGYRAIMPNVYLPMGAYTDHWRQRDRRRPGCGRAGRV